MKCRTKKVHWNLTLQHEQSIHLKTPSQLHNHECRTFPKKSPTFLRKSPTFLEKTPTFFEKAPMFFEESPSFSRQPATFEGNLKMIRRESEELSGDFIPLARNLKTRRKGNATNFSHNLKSAHFRVGHFHANIAGIARHISILAQRSILVLTQHSKKTQGALSAN